MNLAKQIMVVISGLLSAVSITQAASATFVKKEINQQGKMEYTYRYYCAGRNNGLIAVISDKDDVAHKLAEKKAKVVCEE